MTQELLGKTQIQKQDDRDPKLVDTFITNSQRNLNNSDHHSYPNGRIHIVKSAEVNT